MQCSYLRWVSSYYCYLDRDDMSQQCLEFYPGPPVSSEPFVRKARVKWRHIHPS